jgi:hypothetical protein
MFGQREPGKKYVCRGCRQPMPEGANFFGRQMWHHMEPTCRHRPFVLCPECYRKNDPALDACPECGCKEFYT